MRKVDDEVTPVELLAEADKMLRGVYARTGGLWPRAAAFLSRQALELAVTSFWASHEPRMRGCQMRAQMICIRGYVGEGLAGRAYQTWGELSGACHYHAYDLSPTVGELRSWMGAVGALVKEIGSAARARRTDTASHGVHLGP